ncbi:glycoside hydrolase family 53 protein [Pseudochryseolinea flava]|nr:glycosyl hydrolase 53 family protein [Pseudochryseolinea flava]
MIRQITFCSVLLLFCCSSDPDQEEVKPPVTTTDDFLYGADLSYVNQVLDKDGVFKVGGTTKDPYKIFAEKGTKLTRFRLWHNPSWTKEVYGDDGTQLYNDYQDVEKSITRARAEGMKILLDFHYSDTWADPSKQFIPEAWTEITSIEVLKDSVYNYTFKTLKMLNAKGLMPEFVQLGNESNCGMLYSEAPEGFPNGNGCDGQWSNLGQIINAGIKAVRDVAATSTVKTKIILHVADPKNVDWWFTNITSSASVTNFDIIGFSYYPLWHTTVTFNKISDNVAAFKSKFNKDVIILETAYPWTVNGNDGYNNLLGGTPLSGYPFSEQGQYDFMVALTKEVKDGKGIGVIYWEPAWISSKMKDLWGTGSAWENAAFFNYNGNAMKAFDYATYKY